MSIQDQLQIVEDNLNEYGQCNITFEEFNFLKEQVRADAIEEYMNILLKNFSSTSENRKILLSIVRADIRLRAEQLLKEQNETEEWHSIHGNVIMPKGTFDRIYNSCCDDDDDDI